VYVAVDLHIFTLLVFTAHLHCSSSLLIFTAHLHSASSPLTKYLIKARLGDSMASPLQLTFIGTSFLFCSLIVFFLLHTAVSQFDYPRLVTVKSFEPHRLVIGNERDSGSWPHLQFKSSPLRPPHLDIIGKASENAGSYLFMTPRGPHR
jgi:hypothetical protein